MASSSVGIILTLVSLYSDGAQALRLRRGSPVNGGQSVTGSLQAGESHEQAAARELCEETGLTDEGILEYAGVSRQFAIDPRWRKRFAPGVVENVEFEWRYRVPKPMDIRVDDNEHTDYRWLPIAEAVDTVWSWTNRDALRSLLTL